MPFLAMTRVAVFVSGSGTNCENLIKHFKDSQDVDICLVLSNRPDAYALVRAQRLGVPTEVVVRRELNDPVVLMPLMDRYGVEFIVLAGFLPKVPDFLIEAYPEKIVNLHPALLPKFGGKGMYGMHVHEAVKAAGEKETGMTVHYVNSRLDEGRIIAQFSVPLTGEEDAEEISAKEHVLEMRYFPEVIENLLKQQ